MAKISSTLESSIDSFNFNYRFTRYLHNWRKIVLHIQQRLPEYGGIGLLSAGVVLLLSSLSYTSLPLYPSDLQAATSDIHVESLHLHAEPALYSAHVTPFDFYLEPMGMGLAAIAFAAIAAGYQLIRKHTIYLSSFVIWLIVVEALAESSILGWLIKTQGLMPPLPGSRWGVLSSTWLEYLVGLPGALLLPALILLMSYGCRWHLRKSAGENPEINFFRFKFKATFR